MLTRRTATPKASLRVAGRPAAADAVQESDCQDGGGGQQAVLAGGAGEEEGCGQEQDGEQEGAGASGKGQCCGGDSGEEGGVDEADEEQRAVYGQAPCPAGPVGDGAGEIEDGRVLGGVGEGGVGERGAPHDGVAGGEVRAREALIGVHGGVLDGAVGVVDGAVRDAAGGAPGAAGKELAMGDLDDAGHVEGLVRVLPRGCDQGEDGEEWEREGEIEGRQEARFIFEPGDWHPNSVMALRGRKRRAKRPIASFGAVVRRKDASARRNHSRPDTASIGPGTDERHRRQG